MCQGKCFPEAWECGGEYNCGLRDATDEDRDECKDDYMKCNVSGGGGGNVFARLGSVQYRNDPKFSDR